MGDYIFDEWNPSPIPLILSLILLAMTVYRASLIDAVLIGITYLFLGWAFSFSKRKKKNERRNKRKS